MNGSLTRGRAVPRAGQGGRQVLGCCGADGNRAATPGAVRDGRWPTTGPASCSSGLGSQPRTDPPVTGLHTGASYHAGRHQRPHDTRRGTTTPRVVAPRAPLHPGTRIGRTWPHPRDPRAPGVRIVSEPVRSGARRRSPLWRRSAPGRERGGRATYRLVPLVPESFPLRPFVVGAVPFVAGHAAHRTTSSTIPADGRGPQARAAASGPGIGDEA